MMIRASATRNLARFVHRHSNGKDQFDQIMIAVRRSPDMIALGKDSRGEERFTSRQMIETEQRPQRASELMAERRRHDVNERSRDGALVRAAERGLVLSGEQRGGRLSGCAQHELREDVTISTERGERQFASGDRIMFLRNERELA